MRYQDVLTAGLTVVVLSSFAPGVGAQDPLTANFDWSMPDRFGPDLRTLGGGAGADRIRDYLVTFNQTWEDIDPDHPELGSPAVNPPSWRVDFDARASTGAIVSYRWEIDGVEAATTASATFSFDFPAEGSYRVALTVADSHGNHATTSAQVVVQDWLIVALGDSYASGEGNPELGGTAWFEDLLGTFADLQAAKNNLSRALDRLKQAQLGYDLTVADVAPARAALANWNAECPSISIACAQATARLVAELARLGFSEASELITKGFQYIKTQIDNLVNAASAALDLAKAGVTTARALVDEAQAAVDGALAEGAAWQTRTDIDGDRASHRSSLSGQALAALAIERADPHTSVTFVHLAYSGARITKESGSSALILDGGKAQVDDVLRLVGNREIDAMVISIGGNDTGFARIMESLAYSDDQICSRLATLADDLCSTAWSRLHLPPELASAVCDGVTTVLGNKCLDVLSGIKAVPKEDPESLLREGLAKLRDKLDGQGAVLEPGRFTLLERYLADEARLPELPPGRLYFTEYPDLAESDDGSVCPDFLTVTADDWRWVRDVMTTDLNATIRDEVTRRGWNFVDGVFAGFSGHGYCANHHWTYHPEESFIHQGDFGGTAHPTADGHVVYGDRIQRALLADLYAGSDLSRPRLPGYGPFYRRGDTNDNGTVDIADAIRTLSWLFAGGEGIICLGRRTANTSTLGMSAGAFVSLASGD